ncbi:DUF45 domain-containing protein [Myxococcota bacterium]|nr:DUF45 domain-containing protein [Myxococcota bacterium]MBU1382879.1 DUF45 domain-containing protein [Myxococcota bacterium]MBU1496685.1 DUF45 domain-containing protein [Myxococcota bacterium]
MKLRIHNNHSEAFWNLLRSIYPDTDTARVELDWLGMKWE